MICQLWFLDPVVNVILDVSNAESIKQAVISVDDILRDRRKQLYAVVNNAGIQSVAPVELLKESQFEHLMRSTQKTNRQ